jgi:hypothetical protein
VSNAMKKDVPKHGKIMYGNVYGAEISLNLKNNIKIVVAILVM